MPHNPPYRLRNALAGFIAGCAALFAAWHHASRPAPQPLAAYYKSSVAPLLDAAAERDRLAAHAALARLHEHFTHFQAGIPAFSEDITGWGTRFGVAGRSVKDLWTKFWHDPDRAHAARDYINTKFRHHIVSEQKLHHAVEDTLAVFRETVTANHNRTLTEIRLAFTMPEAPTAPLPPALTALLHTPHPAAHALHKQQTNDNLIQTGALLAGGVLADAAAKRIVAAIFARLAVNTAASVATEASAAAGATATGGAVGTAGGPAGTIIGVGVGIAVALVVDWWMTDTFKTKLHDQCTTYLRDLERGIITGTPSAPGLRTTLEETARASHTGFRAELERSLQ